MNFVYVLLSLKDDKLYVGLTGNVLERVANHNAGKVESTKSRRPFELVYYEFYVVAQDARGREKFLKSGSGHRFLKKQLTHYFEKRNGGVEQSGSSSGS